MIYTAIDPERKKVVDVIPHGDETHYMDEYVKLYNEITGNNVQTFTSLEEAKRHCLDAIHNKTFGRMEARPTPPVRPPWLKEDGTPTVNPPVRPATETHATRSDGPIAKAREIFKQMWGSPRKDIIEACAAAGIKRSTASTQYQHYKQFMEHQADYRNEKTGMPQLAPGTRVGDQDSKE